MHVGTSATPHRLVPRLSRLAVVLLLALPSLARASVISFTGDLRTDATFLPPGPTFTDADFAQYAATVYTFHVASASTVTATTFSYGGGTNGNGTVIASGGFEPYLSLFDSAGNFLSSTFFGTTCPPGAGIFAGACYDVQLNAGTLGPGNYQVAISAFENLSFAENYGSGSLADGFTGLGNLAAGEDLHFAFDVDLNSSVTPVPEPLTLVPMALSLATYALSRLRRKEKSR